MPKSCFTWVVGCTLKICWEPPNAAQLAEGMVMDAPDYMYPPGTTATVEPVGSDRVVDARLTRQPSGLLLWISCRENLKWSYYGVRVLTAYVNPDVDEKVDWICD